MVMFVLIRIGGRLILGSSGERMEHCMIKHRQIPVTIINLIKSPISGSETKQPK
jgi:hypothetical protein